MRRRLILSMGLSLLAGCGGAPADPARAPGSASVSLPPLPAQARPHAVQPQAGVSAQDAIAPAAPEPVATVGHDARPRGPASATRGRSGLPPAIDGSVNRATALPNGVALPPLQAPDAVLKVIEAGNVIARSPYVWGGGHGRFLDRGYDCSGSLSFALYSAGLIEGPRTSGDLESWGKPGPGRWITVYANAGHTFMEVAGIRFDTSGQRVTGSRWQNARRPTDGFTVRHPDGL